MLADEEFDQIIDTVRHEFDGELAVSQPPDLVPRFELQISLGLPPALDAK